MKITLKVSFDDDFRLSFLKEIVSEVNFIIEKSFKIELIA